MGNQTHFQPLLTKSQTSRTTWERRRRSLEVFRNKRLRKYSSQGELSLRIFQVDLIVRCKSIEYYKRNLLIIKGKIMDGMKGY